MSRKRFLIDVHMQIDLELDDLVIDRCVNNEDEDGVPQERSDNGTGWRDHYYDLDTAESVAQHLAYNLGIKERSLSSLDGWGDLADDDLATTHFVGIDYEVRATR